MSDERSGQITVTTAGTEVQGPATRGAWWAIKGHPSNTGQIYVGNVGATVSSTTVFTLAAGDIVYIRIHSLDALWFDSSVNGEKAVWLSVMK